MPQELNALKDSADAAWAFPGTAIPQLADIEDVGQGGQGQLVAYEPARAAAAAASSQDRAGVQRSSSVGGAVSIWG